MAKFDERFASKITNNIYLGGSLAAHSIEFLETKKITHILNVADDVSNTFLNNFVYKHLPVADCGADKGISRIFNEAVEFYHELSKEESNIVLIHCAHGINRSVTVTVAILMRVWEWDLKKTWKYVEEKRELAFPFVDNRIELIKYEFKLYGKNSIAEHQFVKQRKKKNRNKFY